MNEQLLFINTRLKILQPLLYILQLVYALVVRVRALLYRLNLLKSKKLKNRVISIGNLTTGGTGKTPFVELTARLMKDEGENVVILSRGYKAANNSQVAFVSDGFKIITDWRRAGDEPFLLASNLPDVKVVIGKDRYAAGKMIEQETENCLFILDDGYQHLKLARDLNILLIDATDPFGDGKLLPLGRLREPLREIQRADLIVITRSDHPFDEQAIMNKIRRYNKTVHIVFAYHDAVGFVSVKEKDAIDMRQFFSLPVVAMAGVAKPEIFFKDLAHFQVDVVKEYVFRDHHNYNQSEIDSVIVAAKDLRARAVVTTQKDAVKVADLDMHGFPFYYCKIQARVDDQARYKMYLESALGRY